MGGYGIEVSTLAGWGERWGGYGGIGGILLVYFALGLFQMVSVHLHYNLQNIRFAFQTKRTLHDGKNVI